MRAVLTLVLALGVAAGGSRAIAQVPGECTDASLRAYMARPYDKAALMNTRMPLGSYRGTPLVAEFPCADVCPSYTIRIVHFVLPEDVQCKDVGGVLSEVLVPVAISVRSEIFCMPAIVANAGQPTR